MPIGRDGRRARKERQSQRIRRRENGHSSLRLDRLGPIQDLLHQYRIEHSAEPRETPIKNYVRHVEGEVTALERWATKRKRSERRSGQTTRVTLDLLRTFGRITELDFTDIPIEERALLVRLLALEHRWCYAAAGTTRSDFKRTTGRTGAR